jgi:hypothetical protein
MQRIQGLLVYNGEFKAYETRIGWRIRKVENI